MNEQEMRELPTPWPKSESELFEYIREMIGGREDSHDYGTCVYAMSLASIATFNYIASELGCTGFQAGAAHMDFIRRSRNIKGPFMICDVSKHLFPQYNMVEELTEFAESHEVQKWLKENAQKRLIDLEAEDDIFSSMTAGSVIEHWQKLAEMQLPEE